MVSATFMQKTVLLATPVQPNVVSTGVASRRVYRSGLAKGVLETCCPSPKSGCESEVNGLSSTIPLRTRGEWPEPKIPLRLRGEWPELDIPLRIRGEWPEPRKSAATPR